MDCGSYSRFRRALPLALAGSGAVALLAFGSATFAGTPAGVVRTIVAPDSAPITGAAQPEGPAAPSVVAPDVTQPEAPASVQDGAPATTPQVPANLPPVSRAQRDGSEDLPLVGALPLGAITGALGNGLPVSGLPVSGLPGGLPTGGLPTGALPVKTPDLSQVNGNVANLPLSSLANAKLPQTSGGAPGLAP